MRNNALKLAQGLRAAGALREAARQSAAPFSASRFLSVLSNSAGSGSIAVLKQQQLRLTPALSLALNEALSRALHSSGVTSAEALTEVAVEGDAEGVLKELDKIVSSEGVSAKEVADAAVALAYLQAKGNRRLWGKVVEKAGALKGSFDAASLTSLLWALTTAGVEHYKTVAELSGTAASLLKSMTPAQVSLVAEAMGKAGVQDADLYARISDMVSAKPGDMKAAELARTLWGFGAAGVHDAKLAKAAGKALSDKSGELSSREAAQALWSLAAMGRAGDKASIDALSKALRSKLSSVESAADAAAAAWALGHLGVRDAATGKALADALKAGAADLSATQAVQAALGLGQMGAGDSAAVSALFAVAAPAVEKAPASMDVAVLAQLHAAAAYTPDAKLPAAVAAYAEKAFGLAVDGARHTRPGAVKCFAEDLSDAVALAMGARYRPEVASAKKGFAKAAPDGSLVEIAVDAEAGTKLAIIGVEPAQLSTTTPATPLGSVAALAKVREAQGYKVVLIPHSEWAGLTDTKAKAGAVLAAVKRNVPGLSSKVDGLSKKLAEPFDPYAQ